MDPLPPVKPDRIFQIVGIAGSLRQGSFDRALLRTATELAPATLRITVHDLLPIPPLGKQPRRAVYVSYALYGRIEPSTRAASP